MAWRVEKFSTNLLLAANSNNLAMSDGRDWSRTALWSEPKNNLYDIHRAIARIYGWNTDETPGAPSFNVNWKLRLAKYLQRSKIIIKSIFGDMFCYILSVAADNDNVKKKKKKM